MRHTFESHSSAPNFSFTCGLSGCMQTLKTYSGISSHLRRKHPTGNFDDLEVECPAAAFEQDTGVYVDEPNFDSEPQVDPDKRLESDKLLSSQRSAALLLINLKERHRLTQSAVNFTVGQVGQMLAHVLDDVKASLKDKLGEVDIDECFDVDPFCGLETEALQSKFYREHFNLVVSDWVIAR